ncbi:MAG: DoxX family protein [Anaerolineae bacterium]|nr:DoxX family protein [Anaerolineae bacterium]
MNIVLWILQVLLAAEFVFHGWIFLFPPADLVDIMNANYAPWFRIFLGVAEWLGAAGLILPGLTRMMPWLTPLASLGLMIVTGSATVYHLSRGETSSAIMTAVLFVLCASVAYMRWRVKPITGPQIA